MDPPHPQQPGPRRSRALSAAAIVALVMLALGAAMLVVVLWVGVPAWLDHARRQAETGVPDPGPPRQDTAAPQPPGAPGTRPADQPAAPQPRCRTDVPAEIQPPECRR